MNKKSYWQRRKRSLINLVGGFMIIIAVALAAFLFFNSSRELQGWYEGYQQYMEYLGEHVLNLRNTWLILLAVLVLYAARSWLPIPIPILAAITGSVLPMYLSVAVNIAGLMALFSVRYHWGRKRGGGQVKKLIVHQQDIRDYIENGRGSKTWLLFLFRLLPNFTLNSVSQIYGAMGYDYTDFILISIIGYLPKLLSYTALGNNVWQPLGWQFIVPLIIVFTLLGISIICVNIAVHKHPKAGGTS